MLKSIQVTGKRLKKQNKEVTSYISSIFWDRRLLKQVLRINTAHTLALYEAGEISEKDAKSIVNFLKSFTIEDEVDEDIHYLIERSAIKKLGIDVAGQMNLGKSRNDQVATAIRMELRETILSVVEELLKLQSFILSLSEKYKRNLIPAYTHLQRAQPVLISYHFIAYFDSISRSVERLFSLYSRVNLSPMGSAALAGTTIAINRMKVAELLSFDGIIRNGIDAVSSRDFVLDSISCIITVALDLSRFAEEIVLWSSSEFDFIELPDETTATSSIMPQKKNPVVAEIIRARSIVPLSSLVSSFSIMKALPYSYNLDLQEVSPNLWVAFDTVRDAVNMVSRIVSSLSFKVEAIEKKISHDYTCASFIAEYLSTSKKVRFRVSHAIVGEIVRSSIKKKIKFGDAIRTLLPVISKKYSGKKVLLSEKEIEKLLNPMEALRMIKTEGGSNPDDIDRELKIREEILERDMGSLNSARLRLREGLEKLEKEASKFGCS